MQITVTNLHKTYQKSLDAASREVLKGLEIKVEAGEKVAIMGPSGSGKTTLLNLLGTLDFYDEGHILLGKSDLNDLSTNEILGLRNRKIGYVFQFHHLLPQCTLWENVLLPTLPHKRDKSKTLQRAEELLRFMGIWDYRNSKPGELSGGECQRAAVARALVNQPEILLADEPTGSLDERNATLLIDLMMTINKQMNITMVIATHSIDIARRMDKIYRIKEGKLELLPVVHQNNPKIPQE
jgi:lipoprotein-releasing system ATP-binding protein